MKRSNTISQSLRPGKLNSFAQVCLNLLRCASGFVLCNGHLYQAFCLLPQQSRCHALCGSHNGATCRVLCLIADSCRLQGSIVCKCGMTTGMRQINRVIRRSFIQRGIERDTINGTRFLPVPFILVPTHTKNPGASRRRICRGGNLTNNITVSLRLAQI